MNFKNVCLVIYVIIANLQDTSGNLYNFPCDNLVLQESTYMPVSGKIH